MSSSAIIGFVGPNGGGKTLAMVELLAEPALAKGWRVIANFELFHEKWERLVSWRQLNDLETRADVDQPVILLLDEITSVLPSREAMRLPAQLARVTNQLRKANVTLGWSAPAWARADVMLREVTQSVWVCRGMFSDFYERDDGKHAFPFRGKKGEPLSHGWGSHCLFRWEEYDAVALDEFTYNRAEKIGALRRKWYWRPNHTAHRLYRTLDPVQLLDHLDDAGLCVNCGGVRRRPTCKCKSGHGLELAASA